MYCHEPDSYEKIDISLIIHDDEDYWQTVQLHNGCYSVYKDPKIESNKWKNKLSDSHQIDRIAKLSSGICCSY